MIDRNGGPPSSSVRSEQVSPSRPAEGGQDDEMAAGAMAASSEPSDVAGLSKGRLAEIRQRLASGMYDFPEVVDVVIQRMKQQGDL